MTNLQEFIEDRIWDIKRVFNDMKYWISHRTYDKYHVVRTGLPVGYSDVVEKMLHTNFTMLVDFIEVEKAWLNQNTTARFCSNRAGYNRGPWLSCKSGIVLKGFRQR